MNPSFYPVILSGGSGSRLWPLSRRILPKQLLPLVSERTPLQETVLRLEGVEGCLRPLVVSNDEHRFLVAEQVREIGIRPEVQILEPIGRNTAPAIAAAALCAVERDGEALLAVLPSDHLIRDVAAFRLALATALSVAAEGSLVTFGIVPDSPNTGYGYIERGTPVPGHTGAYRVVRFIEKPDAETAGALISRGGFSWNSGMFVCKAARLLEELGRFRPDILESVRAAWLASERDLDFLRLEMEAFSSCPAESFDRAVMERTGAAAMVEVDMGWSDVGSWAALWEVSDKDERNNVSRGDVQLHDVSGCYVRAESRLVSAVGVRDLVIVETDDAVLVTDKAHAQEVKDVVERLGRQARTEHVSHSRVYRPWGYYESIDAGARYQVKRLMLKPGAKISLQRHQHRAEHWVVVSGRARVVRGDQKLEIGENESTFIPLGSRHRMENIGDGPLLVIEVQSGDYLGEDDIERFADDYNRA